MSVMGILRKLSKDKRTNHFIDDFSIVGHHLQSVQATEAENRQTKKLEKLTIKQLK